MSKRKLDYTKLQVLIKEHLNPTQITTKINEGGIEVTRQGIIRAIESLVKSGNVRGEEVNYQSDRFKKLAGGNTTTTRRGGAPSNGGIILRDKHYSLTEVLEALSPQDIMPKLSSEQINTIAAVILKKAMEADRVIETARKVPNLEAQIKDLQKQVREADQNSLKQLVVQKGSQVVYGD